MLGYKIVLYQVKMQVRRGKFVHSLGRTFVSCRWRHRLSRMADPRSHSHKFFVRLSSTNHFTRIETSQGIVRNSRLRPRVTQDREVREARGTRDTPKSWTSIEGLSTVGHKLRIAKHAEFDEHPKFTTTALSWAGQEDTKQLLKNQDFDYIREIMADVLNITDSASASGLGCSKCARAQETSRRGRVSLLDKGI